MKSIKLLALSALAVFAVDASAQLTKNTEEWTRVELSFNAQKMKAKDDDHSTDGQKTKGAAVAFMKGVNLTTKLPLFLDLGARLTWNHAKESRTGGDEKWTFMNIAVPVNAAYKLSFASSPVTIVPFFGPNFKFNFLARHKWEGSDGHDVKHNLFKEDEGDAKIFQFGLNLGVGVNIRKFYVGYHFQPDLSSFQKDGDYKVKTLNNYVSVGLNF